MPRHSKVTRTETALLVFLVRPEESQRRMKSRILAQGKDGIGASPVYGGHTQGHGDMVGQELLDMASMTGITGHGNLVGQAGYRRILVLGHTV